MKLILLFGLSVIISARKYVDNTTFDREKGQASKTGVSKGVDKHMLLSPKLRKTGAYRSVCHQQSRKCDKFFIRRNTAPPIHHQFRRRYPFKHLKHLKHSKGADDGSATRGMFPFNVGIFTSNQTFFGGALITRCWVLTAARTVAYGAPWTIMLGGIYHNRDCYDPYRKMRISSVGIKHPHWSLIYQNENNIGLLKLPCLADLNEMINIIPLAPKCSIHDRFYGAKIKVIGWAGCGSNCDESLRYAFHLTEKISECGTICDPGGSYFCSRPVISQPGLSVSDIGGPAIYRDAHNGKITLVGIVSEISSCYFKYTRTAYYLDWIQDVTDVKIDKC